MELGWAIRKQFPKTPHFFDVEVDEILVRGTRSLCDIYQRRNVDVLEPIEFEEAEKDEKWINDIKKELKMIVKNWHLRASELTSK